jgi:hypothetical protein
MQSKYDKIDTKLAVANDIQWNVVTKNNENVASTTERHKRRY